MRFFTNLTFYGLFHVYLFLIGVNAEKCNSRKSSCTATPTATIESGVLIGKVTSLPNSLGPVNQFLGIPFAQSPPERFSPPQAPSRFKRPINATQWKPGCVQQFSM